MTHGELGAAFVVTGVDCGSTRHHTAPDHVKYDAVIFDLFGTLVENYSDRAMRAAMLEISELLAVPFEPFYAGWKGTFAKRATGQLASIEENIRHVCRDIGVVPNDERMAAAVRIRIAFAEGYLKPSGEVIALLSRLRQEGYRIGLISDCSSDVEALWVETPLAPLIDAAIFSCAVGVRKPDPLIYHTVCERLGVSPDRCLYVGDGGSGELTGAAAVGMYPVLIHSRNEDEIRYDADEWSGVSVSDLDEIFDML